MATVESRPSDLERLYVEHGERVRAICASILRDRQEAEDAAQQVFVSALRALRSGTDPRDPDAWLATIARHECWARAGKQEIAPLPAELEDVVHDDPATATVRSEELASAWETIAELPPAQRTAFLLREVRGLGYDEVAADLRVSRASVRSLLSRARTTLRRQLEKGAGVLTGAPWLNVLARLFGDGPTPAVSSATRTAAVGFGALVVTSGAAVAPVLAHHSSAHQKVRHERASVASHHAATAVSSIATATPSHPMTVARTPARADDGGSHGGRGAGVGDRTRHGRTRSGEDTVSTTDTSGGGPGPSGVTGETSGSGSSGGPGPSGVSGETTSGASTSSGSSGSGVSGSSGGPGPSVETTIESSATTGGVSSESSGSGSSGSSGGPSPTSGSDGGGSRSSSGGSVDSVESGGSSGSDHSGSSSSGQSGSGS